VLRLKDFLDSNKLINYGVTPVEFLLGFGTQQGKDRKVLALLGIFPHICRKARTPPHPFVREGSLHEGGDCIFSKEG
jgi:hypothetical protein